MGYKLKLCFLLTICVCLVGCGTQKMLKTNIDPKIIDSLIFIKPLSNIVIVDENNKEHYDTSLLNLSISNLKSGIKKVFSKRITFIENNFDSITQKRIDNEIFKTAVIVEKTKSIKNIPYPNTIDSIMKINRVKFALCLFHNGYTVSNEYRKKLGRDALLVSLFSLGAVFVYSVPSTSIITGFIVDSEHQNIAFYRTHKEYGLEPGDEEATNLQLANMFWRYFHYK